MKGFLYFVLGVMLIGVLFFAGLAQEHHDFTEVYGVSAPYFISDDEASVIQPQVTQVIWGLNHQVLAAESELCAVPDGQCVQQKLDSLKDAKKARGYAMSVAALFNFDTTIPQLCADRSYPVGQECKDGSKPSE